MALDCEGLSPPETSNSTLFAQKLRVLWLVLSLPTLKGFGLVAVESATSSSRIVATLTLAPPGSDCEIVACAVPLSARSRGDPISRPLTSFLFLMMTLFFPNSHRGVSTAHADQN